MGSVRNSEAAPHSSEVPGCRRGPSGLPKFVFIHSSDEMYGADRVLLEMVAAATGTVDAEVWLPTDLQHPARPLCEELVRRNVKVRHLTLPIMRRANANVRGVASLLAASRATLKELRASKAHAVYCTTSPTFLVAPLARLARVPRVFGHCQEIWSRSDRLVLAGPAFACHNLLAISHAVAHSMPTPLGPRTRVVPNGTPEPSQLIPLSEHFGPLKFLVASRWNGWKGHKTLLAAWDLAGSPGHLVVLGGAPPSGDSVDVPLLIQNLSDPDSVSLVGEVANTADYLERADVILMPSDRPEPFGLVAIEAFARARPVIGSAAGGLVDIITPDHNGWLFPIQDSEALASVMRRLNRTQVQTAGANARATYEKRFTLERFIDGWSDAVLKPLKGSF